MPFVCFKLLLPCTFQFNLNFGGGFFKGNCSVLLCRFETRLSVSVQLLGPHDVVYLRQLLSDPPQAGVLGDDRLGQGLQAVGGGGGQELKIKK